MKKSGFHSLMIMVLLYISIAFIACESEKVPVMEISEDYDFDQDLAYGVDMVYTDNAEIVLTLKAPELNRITGRTPKDVFPEGILVHFYQEGMEYATLVADYAERLPDQYLVIASDNVVFENINGEKLETSQLKWDERKERIFTDRFAKLTRPDEVIYGYGFSANQDFTEIEFEKTTGKRPVPVLDEIISP